MSKKNHPGIFIPPPLIYVAIFLLSTLLQRLSPIKTGWLHTIPAHIIGLFLIMLYVVLAFASIGRFVKTKNTIITVKPATSLQTTAIYSFSRNPMYLSLVLLYCGLAVFIGNWWTLILLPLLIIIIEQYVIRKEEEYLSDAFGEEYNAYCRQVRRWI